MKKITSLIALITILAGTSLASVCSWVGDDGCITSVHQHTDHWVMIVTCDFLEDPVTHRGEGQHDFQVCMG